MGRRLPVIVVVLLSGLVAALPASARTATGARTGTELIACPLSAGVVSPPCCGPPVAQANARGVDPTATAAACCASAGCCPVTSARTRAAIVPVCCPASTTGAAACPVTAVPTISSSPNPSRTGAAVTVSGTASGSAGTAVTLWEEAPPATSFHEVASTTTDSAGAYRFARPAGSVASNRSWYVTSGGAQSSTIDQQVTAAVTLAAPSTAARAGAVARLTGSVTPAQSGAPVLLLQRAAGDWNVIAHARLRAGSHYAFRHRFAKAGKIQLRVELPANSRNVQSFSAARSLTVSPK